ncbi:fatty acid-binding protein, intestinal-like, partial [Clarias magur]
MIFDGTWKVECSDNYDKFMEVMGINIVKRKLAAHDNLKITLQQDGETFHVKESSTFRTLELDFTLGNTFEYELADGTQLSGCWVMEGDKLKGTFVRRDNGKTLNTVRQIVDGDLVQ